MTNPNYVKALVIQDSSGSMRGLATDVIGGFNSFIDDQKKIPGKFDVTLVQFNSTAAEIFVDRPIQDVAELTSADYQTGGGTALLYAVDWAVKRLGKKLADLPEEERPGKVVVLIQTDGEENMSPREIRREDVKALIEQQQNVFNWEFRFFGANVDAFREAASLGIAAMHTASYSADSKGVRGAYTTMSDTLRTMRTNP